MLPVCDLLIALFSVVRTTKSNNKYEKEKWKAISGSEQFRNSASFLIAI